MSQRIDHNRIEVRTCNICNKVFPSRSGLSHHKKTKKHIYQEEKLKSLHMGHATANHINQEETSIYSEHAENLSDFKMPNNFADELLLKTIQQYWKYMPPQSRPILFCDGDWHVKNNDIWFVGVEAQRVINEFAHDTFKLACDIVNNMYNSTNKSKSDEYIKCIKNIYTEKPLNFETLTYRMQHSLSIKKKALPSFNIALHHQNANAPTSIVNELQRLVDMQRRMDILRR